jgi:hypothetical protein
MGLIDVVDGSDIMGLMYIIMDLIYIVDDTYLIHIYILLYLHINVSTY